jgi:uncharacterized membrane protein
VGISIALLMLSGLLLNAVSLAYGLSQPLSLMPLLTMTSAVVLVLCALAYVKDKAFSDPHFIDTGSLLSPPALFLYLVPFLSVFGTYAFNFYNSNALLIFLLLIIGLIILLVGFGRLIPTNLYPLTIFVTSVSLLFHTSLISQYIVGTDIQVEYSIAQAIIASGFWNSNVFYSGNSMLSLTIFPPVLSIISGMNLVWIFKVIYPLLFSLVPLGLFRAYQKQTNDRIAALSCLFLMVIVTFYVDMVMLAKQQLAELFLVVFILVMLNSDLDRRVKSGLLMLSVFSIAVSHYAVAYLFMFLLACAWLILRLEDKGLSQKPSAQTFSRFRLNGNKERRSSSRSIQRQSTAISPIFILLFIVFTIGWYLYTSQSAALWNISGIGTNIVSNLGQFLNPQATQAPFYAITSASSPLHNVTRYLGIASLFFVAVGIAALLLKNTRMKFARSYSAFALASMGLLVAAVAIPYFASALNTTRLYHFSLIFLAPFAVIGAITCVRTVARRFGASSEVRFVRYAPALFAVFLVLLFQFNNGLVYEIANDNPSSFALSKDIAYPIFNEQELAGATWLTSARATSPTTGQYLPIYADANHYELFESLGLTNGEWISNYTAPGTCYAFLGTYNLAHHDIASVYQVQAIQYTATTSLDNLVSNRSVIYDSGGANILL